MNAILLIFIKLLASSALLTGFYSLLFRGKSSFTASRVFLLSIPLLSVVLSLVSIRGAEGVFSMSALLDGGMAKTPVEAAAPAPVMTETVDAQPAFEGPGAAAVTETVATETAAVAQAKSISAKHVLLSVYALAILAIGAMTFRQMRSLKKIRRRAEKRMISGSPTYFSRDIRASFSVMRSIYVNSRQAEERLGIVISHEKQHILHRHYMDLVLTEIFTMLMWFNPLVWVIRRELRSVHEFQADQSVLGEGVQLKRYMLAILEEATGSIPAMANGLNSSLIKKRFIKMKEGNKVTHKTLRIALTIPFAAVLLVFFAFRPAQRVEPAAETVQDAAETVITAAVAGNEKEPKAFALAASLVESEKDENTETAKTPEAAVAGTSVSDSSGITVNAGQPTHTLVKGDGYITGSLVQNDGSVTAELRLTTNSWPMYSGPVKVMDKKRELAPGGQKAVTVHDFPADMNYADYNIRVAEDGRLVDPDGQELYDTWVMKDLVRFNGKLITNTRKRVEKDQIYGPVSRPNSRILSIECSDKETRVTMAWTIYWDENWAFYDKGTCLIDRKTGDRYIIRDVNGDIEVGRMAIVRGIPGAVVENTLIFPPLKKGVKVVDYFEPDNKTDVTDGNNPGGALIKNIKIADYEKSEPKGQIIR